MFKVGFSKDMHNLIKGKYITLAGQKIECEFSIKAYSDGDVVFHALSEAILGALGKEDIGTYYNKENMPQNFSSLEIVDYVKNLLVLEKYCILNIDILIELDFPNLIEHKKLIKNNILEIFNLRENQVSIKATTTENNFPKLISCYCNLILKKEINNEKI
ncbi:2-C-methyl-D-erythritol 2,4-cyclodiphosphate synthase [Spiroplasma taiwanense]|uniref:2-C-methyl-D-erythritol 2,4-cyclodiphosphate synthase n=1 Tax=Spiroplasma taiwanense CT-1 TaxID=1276220 RepID=S5LYM8_9MOLU|nr:2-C-methyl-D-erythritol 2,4-cyclodiphosphate synthase [Spiroplasma taiwanense]AGR41656.1 2-C-methyl-D-erythritol 2,4-cyclodiphosphate synthase [Spiroplasma taiwanense CT-1]